MEDARQLIASERALSDLAGFAILQNLPAGLKSLGAMDMLVRVVWGTTTRFEGHQSILNYSS